ncbi:transcription factor Sox-11 isoform X2 [Phymastichus coffea]|uniref:transcription factor Sox-11 isoform X2 n=1 Tax=Phymastichus coffea TaxID=108790 RepID=UPI00273B3927|nr:transcription factor Sox-11 isoform X2 [Phymastichus coffea]
MAANEHQQKEEEDGHEPAHHARRPMNAFLIFCKRHRAAVRSGFPHLENRAVTRVLGEWWAMLSNDQKEAYTNLAQEYKDAFLNANPDFKWYKLPAPPLRTLNTRPTNKKTDAGQSDSGSEMTNLKLDEDSIQPGKLADESQIGGLSSLFTPQKVNPKIDISEDEDDDNVALQVPKPPKKRFIELPISAELKEDCKVDLFGDKKSRAESNNNNHHLNMKEDKDEDQTYIDVDAAYRNERTCKGLRYQKFLAEQLTSNQVKQRRITGLPNVDQHTRERRNSISSNVSEKTDSLSSEGTSSRGDLEHLVEGAEGNLEASKPEDTETEGSEAHMNWMSRKRFKAEDFNLEKKIEALPSLSLEEFQAMKKQQRTKKKKILQKVGGISRKTNHDGSPNRISNIQTETEKALLVGSQKRKARKQSITRNTGIVDSPMDVEKEGPNKAWCAPSDLDALVCLAAVAANRAKLTKS